MINAFNDSATEFKKVAEMALELGVEKISLLPYHEAAGPKRIKSAGNIPWTGQRQRPKIISNA